MTEQDRETHAAIEALAHRIRVRDAAIRAAEDCADPEPFAAEFMAALGGRGWRLTEAKAPGALKVPAGGGTGPTEEWRQARAELERRRTEIAEGVARFNEPPGAA